jgi:hypothetical protein
VSRRRQAFGGVSGGRSFSRSAGLKSWFNLRRVEPSNEVDEDRVDWVSLVDEMHQRERRVRSLPGGRVAFGIDALSATHRLLQRNASELATELDTIRTRRRMEAWESTRKFDVTAVWGDREPEEFQEEMVRLLHNFLASVKTLVDHTRNLVRDLWGKDSSFESGPYKKAVQSHLRDHANVVFMQDLRNYMLHYERVPIFVSTLIAPDGAVDNVTVLDHVALQEWSGWTRRIRDTLMRRRIPIPLGEAVNGYMECVDGFYQWFHAATLEEHAEDLREYDKARADYRAWLAIFGRGGLHI